MFLGGKTEVFDPASDWLGMICVRRRSRSGPQSRVFEEGPSPGTEQLAQRLPLAGYASEKERELFQSFTCPASLASTYGPSLPPTAPS